MPGGPRIVGFFFLIIFADTYGRVSTVEGCGFERKKCCLQHKRCIASLSHVTRQHRRGLPNGKRFVRARHKRKVFRSHDLRLALTPICAVFIFRSDLSVRTIIPMFNLISIRLFYRRSATLPFDGASLAAGLPACRRTSHDGPCAFVTSHATPARRPHVLRNASRSVLSWSLCVSARPWGAPL